MGLRALLLLALLKSNPMAHLNRMPQLSTPPPLPHTLRILCLHGKQQNKETFRTKLGNIPRKLKALAALTIVDAPHALPDDIGEGVGLGTTSTSASASTSTPSPPAPATPTPIPIPIPIPIPGRAWFLRDAEGLLDPASLHTSLQFLQKVWAERGPFDGVLGFSMGGTMASLLAHLSGEGEGEGGAEGIETDCGTNLSGSGIGNSDSSRINSSSSSSSSVFSSLRFVILAGAVDVPDPLAQALLWKPGNQSPHAQVGNDAGDGAGNRAGAGATIAATEAAVAASMAGNGAATVSVPMPAPMPVPTHNFRIPSRLSSLHLAGEGDRAVPIASSRALAARYAQGQGGQGQGQGQGQGVQGQGSQVFLTHPGGHYIPMSKEVLGAVVAFVQSQYVQ
ncbi:serine hydrolase FSH [Ochromonadaceae sp. CCMP2298]|nr:serine hydrolase FSH [Ochromonadaceae sp. CCMP2298]